MDLFKVFFKNILLTNLFKVIILYQDKLLKYSFNKVF